MAVAKPIIALWNRNFRIALAFAAVVGISALSGCNSGPVGGSLFIPVWSYDSAGPEFSESIF